MCSSWWLKPDTPMVQFHIVCTKRVWNMEGRPDRNARRSNQEDRKQFVPCKYWSFRPHHPKTSVPGCQPRFLLGPVHGDSHLLHKQLLYIHAVTCQLTVTPRCMLAWTITPSTSELMQRGVTFDVLGGLRPAARFRGEAQPWGGERPTNHCVATLRRRIITIWLWPSLLAWFRKVWT